jgi:geranylgeranyl pyrophosphate synthase
MNPKEHKATSKILLEEFRRRSERGLDLARNALLTEKIKSDTIYKAAEYYTDNWTDFIHSGLFSMACEAVGGNPDDVLRTQVSIILITDAFDMHDDIIDESSVKHGKPTVFGKFGKEAALLLGNAFLVKGLTLLCESVQDIPQDKRKKILETLEDSLFEVGNAHAFELKLTGRINITPDELMPILEMKAASIEADMRIAAIISGGTDSEVEALTRYGRIIGMLVILREEFIDIFEPGELDQRMKKEYPPIPILCAFQNESAKRHVIEILSKNQIKSKDTEKIIDIVLQTTETQKLKEHMKKLINSALRSLSRLKQSTVKLSLRNLAIATLEDL